MPYPVAAVRGKNFNNQVAIPWYLSGGVAAANCLAAYQPKGAADLDASYINLITPGTNNAVVGTAPSFDTSTGWTFNGSSQYLEAGTIIGTNSQSGIVRFTNAVSSTKAMFGVNVATGNAVRFHIYPYYPTGSGVAYFRAGGTYNTGSGTYYTNGVLAVTPAKAYANGSPLGNLASPWTGTATTVIRIGGNTSELWAGKIQAIAFYNTTLSDAQVLAISTAMAAL